jgi:type II secretion system protein L
MAKIDLKNALLLYFNEAWAAGREGAMLETALYGQQGKFVAAETVPPETAALMRNVIAIAPAGAVLISDVEAPARNRARFIQALPNVIERLTGAEADHIHTAPGPWNGSGRLPVAVTGKAWIEGALARLKTGGLTVTSMIPETLLPPIAEKRWSLVIGENTCFIKTGPLAGMALDTPTHPRPPEGLLMLVAQAREKDAAPEAIRVFVIGDHPSPNIAEWETALSVKVESAGPWNWRPLSGSAQETIELLQGPLAPPRPPIIAKWGAVSAPAMAALTGIIFMTTLALKARSMRIEEAELKSRIEKSFHKAMGNAAMADPLSQTSQTLDNLRWRAGLAGPAGVDGLLAQAAEPITAHAKLKTLAYSKGELKLTLVMNKDAIADSLFRKLKDAGVVYDNLGSVNRPYGQEVTLVIKEAP